MTLETLVRRLSPVTFDELLYQVEKHEVGLSPQEILFELRELEKNGTVHCDLVITTGRIGR